MIWGVKEKDGQRKWKRTSDQAHKHHEEQKQRIPEENGNEGWHRSKVKERKQHKETLM